MILCKHRKCGSISRALLLQTTTNYTVCPAPIHKRSELWKLMNRLGHRRRCSWYEFKQNACLNERIISLTVIKALKPFALDASLFFPSIFRFEFSLCLSHVFCGLRASCLPMFHISCSNVNSQVCIPFDGHQVEWRKQWCALQLRQISHIPNLIFFLSSSLLFFFRASINRMEKWERRSKNET